MKGQPDIMIMNYRNNHSGFCLEFKSPTNNYQISEAQKEMKTGKKIMFTTLRSAKTTTLLPNT